MIRQHTFCIFVVGTIASVITSLGNGQWLASAHAQVPAVLQAEGAANPATTDRTDLALSATIIHRDLLVAWNPRAACLANARGAALTVSDSGHTETVELGAGVLNRGGIAYSPIGRDVSFQLTVSEPDGTQSCLESVLVLNRGAAR